MMAVIRNDPALSEMHGGGPLLLFVLSAEKDHAKYEFTESARGDSS